MPVLGMNLPDELVSRTRTTLLSHVLGSSKLRETLSGSLKLSRRAYTGDYALLRWSATDGFEQIGLFGMLPLPGCWGICVFHHVEVMPIYRRLGIGTELQRIRLAVAKEVGYSLALCTVDKANLKERALLTKQGWHCDVRFKNFKTSHTVNVWTKKLY